MTTLTEQDLGKNFLAVDKTTWKFETAVLTKFISDNKYEFSLKDGSIIHTCDKGNSEDFSVYVNDEELEDNFPNN